MSGQRAWPGLQLNYFLHINPTLLLFLEDSEIVYIAKELCMFVCLFLYKEFCEKDCYEKVKAAKAKCPEKQKAGYVWLVLKVVMLKPFRSHIRMSVNKIWIYLDICFSVLISWVKAGYNSQLVRPSELWSSSAATVAAALSAITLHTDH